MTKVLSVQVNQYFRRLANVLYIGNFRKGYLKQNVTPYMHCLVYHIPFLYHPLAVLRNFGQVVDQSNDNIKMIHQRKSASCSPSSETFDDSSLGGLLWSVPPKQLYLYKYCHIFMFFTHKFYKYCPSILRGLMEITEMFFR